MPKQHIYVLGLNTCDHDVSACLLRDGAIAFAIAKERITRDKHASGFYKEVIDYCLDAEGITVDDVDLIVRNSYILPVSELEGRLVYQDRPGFLPDRERLEAGKLALYLSRSDRVVSISHHLAHAYSAFAVSPFEEGVVMIVDGVGSYRLLREFEALTGVPVLINTSFNMKGEPIVETPDDAVVSFPNHRNRPWSCTTG
jgi:carbamoyltransferase